MKAVIYMIICLSFCSELIHCKYQIPNRQKFQTFSTIRNSLDVPILSLKTRKFIMKWKTCFYISVNVLIDVSMLIAST